MCIKFWLGNVILHNYPCCTCSVCPRLQILQSKPREGVSKQKDRLPHIGMCHGICKWTAKWWAIQPEWSVCSNNKDGRCKPNIGSWRHDFPDINYTVWPDRQEGWHRRTWFHIFSFLHFLIKIQENFLPFSPVSLVPEENRIMCPKRLKIGRIYQKFTSYRLSNVTPADTLEDCRDCILLGG